MKSNHDSVDEAAEDAERARREEANEKAEQEKLAKIVEAAALSIDADQKRQLRCDLAACLSWWRIASALRPKVRRSQRELVDEARRSAKKLYRILGDPDRWAVFRERLYLDDLPLPKALRQFIEALEQPRATPRQPGTWYQLNDRSPFDVLVGRLVKAFEKNFGAKATVSQATNNTPFLRFANAFLKANRIRSRGRDHKATSIIRAVSLARGTQGRRSSA